MDKPSTSQVNIDAIIRMEEEGDADRTATERISERIGHFAGTLSFVAMQMVFVAAWIAINARGGFDPYPFPLLGGLLAFEAVTLTAFVLIRQNRMSLRADRRNHLDLQINLLAEQEATKIIQMLERMSRQLGIEGAVSDQESRDLSGDTSIETIARDLKQGLADQAEGKKGEGKK
jgi:uncharacterized membrane protein